MRSKSNDDRLIAEGFEIDEQSDKTRKTGRTWMWVGTVVWLVCSGLVVQHYWYSIGRTLFLKYPEEGATAYLPETVRLEVGRGFLGDVFVFELREGEYELVLENDDGGFYLAPERGFYTRQTRSTKGLAVGGFYVSKNQSEPVYVWQYLLENSGRSFASPSKMRPLNDTEDQPEREYFLDAGWYATKSFSLLGRPMIEQDFVVERSAIEFGRERGTLSSR